MVTPLFFIGLLVITLWILVTSILLSTRGSAAPAGEISTAEPLPTG
jgi:hypothetical protein